MKGVKEILELIAGLKEVALLAKLSLKDGKIDMADLPLLMQLLNKQKVLSDALTGLGEVVGEAKDLTVDEGILIVQAIMQAGKEVKEA